MTAPKPAAYPGKSHYVVDIYTYMSFTCTGAVSTRNILVCNNYLLHYLHA
uniref:Uncharacterized protein n=1 Tax=Arion vulgaris TaxID=1028688 RepID=A0A0B7B4C6_9EUPU